VGGTELQVCALFKKVFRLWYSRAQAYTVYTYIQRCRRRCYYQTLGTGEKTQPPRNPKWGKIRMKHLRGLETKLYMYAGMPLKKSPILCTYLFEQVCDGHAQILL
jgi:hypothetical protein